MLTPHIKSFIDMLDEAAEDRILVGKLIPLAGWSQSKQAGCLIGLACNFQEDADRGIARWRHMATEMHLGNLLTVPSEFDELCFRHGEEAVGAAIRQRIWDNRAARIPKPESADEGCGRVPVQGAAV